MKTQDSIRFALLTTAALFIQSTFAANGPKPPTPPPPLENWQTVDDFVDGATEAMTVAPNGIIFTAGSAYTGDGYAGVIRASVDGGNTWSTTSAFSYPGLVSTIYSAIASDSAGNLYVSGLAWDYDSTNVVPTHWFVQRSGDGGATWSMVDDFVPGGDWWLWEHTALAVDASGNVFFGFAPNDGTSSWNTYWTVRRGIGGANFTTVDTLSYANDDGPQGLYAHPTAGVFAVGYDLVLVRNKNGTTSSSRAWIVRRSVNGGNTWQTVDTFQLSGIASAAGVGADASGSLYVVGNAVGPAVKGSSWRHWLVRKSNDGGNSWSTVDDYQLDTNNNSWARGFVAAANGNLYVAGSAAVGPNDGTGSNSHWVVRKSLGGSGTWATVDDFRYLNTGSAAQSIAADGFGKVFVGGGGGGHWIVRRSP
jgi:hypothetical protein